MRACFSEQKPENPCNTEIPKKKFKQRNPRMGHKEAFRCAALAWRKAPENPKNTAHRANSSNAQVVAQDGTTTSMPAAAGLVQHATMATQGIPIMTHAQNAVPLQVPKGDVQTEYGNAINILPAQTLHMAPPQQLQPKQQHPQADLQEQDTSNAPQPPVA